MAVVIEEIYSVRQKELAAGEELMIEGYRVAPLGQALRGRSAVEKNELWVTDRIRELLGEPELPRDRPIDEPGLNEQAWLVTRRRKETTTTVELRANVERTFWENGFEMFVAPEARRESAVTIGLDDVIDQGVRSVFERESIARTDLLVGEIVRPAPGQAGNFESEASLEDQDGVVREKVGR